MKRVELPEWAKTTSNDCLRVVAEDAYRAKALAVEDYGADQYDSCQELLRAGDKSLAGLEDRTASIEHRTQSGERAARYFWEAKTCARRVRKQRP